MFRILAARARASALAVLPLFGSVGLHAQTVINQQVGVANLTFNNGEPCYYRNAFFNKNVQAVVQNDQAGQQINQYGYYTAVTLPAKQNFATAPGLDYYLFSDNCDGRTTSAWVAMPTGQVGVPDQMYFNNTPPTNVNLRVQVKGADVLAAAPGTTVDLVASASDVDRDPLKYTWRVASGSIVATGARARWTLPPNGGTQFAYVLVSDGWGGYREAGVTISTDTTAAVSGSKPAAIVPAPRGTNAWLVGTPSNTVRSGDHFLTFFSTKNKASFNGPGADSALGACRYYEAIRAVAGCGPNGELLNPTENFDQWKQRWAFGTASAALTATYTNAVDLNLERDMHASGTSQGMAYYVCNYPVNPALPFDNVLNRKNLVACVAMEYSATPGLNLNGGGIAQPYVKFLTFAPSGTLIASVNLDARGEKYMPGACVVCHGASGYSRYSEVPGGSSPAMEAQFLPFDLNNFKFAANTGPLSQAGQEANFANLNGFIAYGPGASSARPALKELIAGWYNNVSNTFNNLFVPPGWVGHEALYNDVVKENCRSCHVAMPAAFDSYGSFAAYSPLIASHVCGYKANELNPRKLWSMPNAKVTFDKFWKNPVAVATLQTHLRSVAALPATVPCGLPNY